MHIWGECEEDKDEDWGAPPMTGIVWLGLVAFGHPTIVARFMIYFFGIDRHGCAVVGRWFKWIRSDTAKLKD